MWLWLAVGGCRQDVLQGMAALTALEVSSRPAEAEVPVDAPSEVAAPEAPPVGQGDPAAEPAAEGVPPGAPAGAPPVAPAEFNPISVPEGPRESSVKWEGVRRAPSDFDRLKSGSSRERDR